MHDPIRAVVLQLFAAPIRRHLDACFDRIQGGLGWSACAFEHRGSPEALWTSSSVPSTSSHREESRPHD